MPRFYHKSGRYHSMSDEEAEELEREQKQIGTQGYPEHIKRK